MKVRLEIYKVDPREYVLNRNYKTVGAAKGSMTRYIKTHKITTETEAMLYIMNESGGVSYSSGTMSFILTNDGYSEVVT